MPCRRQSDARTIFLVASFDAIQIASISPQDVLGLQLHLLEAVAAPGAQPVLIVYQTQGRLVSLGRYHFFAGSTARGGLSVTRRLTGGRAVGAGEGWMQVALILPHRGALLDERDRSLKPEQVMNRYSRGLLAAFRSLGVEAFYPGRDAITSNRREIAMCSFETTAAGTVLFEVMIAVNRGMEELVHEMDRFDPDGAISCRMYGPDSASKLVREMDRDVDFVEAANAIVRGYAEMFGESNVRSRTQEECAQAAHRGSALTERRWLTREIDGAFNRSGQMQAQLGSIGVRLRVSTDHRIESLTLGGDLIANSPGLAELEKQLRGRTHDFPSVSQAVTRTYADGRNYLLGCGDLSSLVKLIVEAQ